MAGKYIHKELAMFTQDGIKIYADLDNSVSHGTLRCCDLLPAFIQVIKDTPEWKQREMMQSCDLQNYQLAIERGEDSWWWEEEQCNGLLDEVFELCDNYAPDGYYFGTHIGDGSDFGYWKND